jgi:hypothetical protein
MIRFGGLIFQTHHRHRQNQVSLVMMIDLKNRIQLKLLIIRLILIMNSMMMMMMMIVGCLVIMMKI